MANESQHPQDIRDTVENRRIVSAIMQTIVDTEPDADPDHPDTIVINQDELDAIIRHHVCGEWHKPWEQYTQEEKNEARGWT